MTDPQNNPASLISYTVEFRPAGSAESGYFHTMARNKDEAMRNTRKANPACTVVSATDANLQTHIASEFSEPWRPSVEAGAYPSLEEIVAQAVGTGSVCWKEPTVGIFDDQKAKWVVDGATETIRKFYTAKHVALPKTHETIDNLHGQIRALRAEIAHQDTNSTEESAEDPWQGARDDDKIYVLRTLLDNTSAQGTDMANFIRRIRLILDA